MTIYSIVIVILLFLFLIEQKGISDKADKRLFLMASFLVFFVMAFRGENVGGDFLEYCHFWEGKDDVYGTWKEPNVLLMFEPGLSWLCYFLHIFNDGDPFFFIFCTSAIILFPFFYIVCRDCKFRVLPVLLYVILWGLLDISYTGLRQVIGVSICLIAYIVWTASFKRNKYKIILTTLLFGLALSFHTSMYFTVPIFVGFLFIKRISKRTCILFLFLSLLFGILFAKFASYLFDIIGALFTSVEFLFRFDHYFEGNTHEDGLTTAVIGLQQIITTSLVCLIVYLSNFSSRNIYYAVSLTIGCSMVNIFVSFPQAGRFIYPLLLMGVMLTPSYMILPKKKIYRIVLISSIIILSLHRIHIWEIGYEDRTSEFYQLSQMFPYKFIWE